MLQRGWRPREGGTREGGPDPRATPSAVPGRHGTRTFDVIWIGGSTTRYRHGVRDIRIVLVAELDAHSREYLACEAEAARRERRAGARIRRGTVSPRR